MDPYVEIVGRVIDANTVLMLTFLNLGEDLGEFLPLFFGLQFTYDFVCINSYARHETRG